MLGRHRKAVSVATVGALSTALLATAFVYDGTPATDVDLNEGGVWVTNSSLSLVGRLNFSSQVLDGAIRTLSPQIDVLQRASTVILADRGSSVSNPIDVAAMALAGESSLPTDGEVFLGADTVAVTAEQGRLVFVMPAQNYNGFDASTAEPVLELDGPAAVTVGTDGTVYAAEPGSGLLWRVEGDKEPTSTDLDIDSADTDLAITAVGDKPVVLNRARGELVLPSGDAVDVDDASNIALQQPSAASDAVVFATSTELVTLPLSGDDAVTAAAGAQGRPTAPVQVQGCSYAAWGGSGRYVRDCPGEESDQAMDIPGAEGKGNARFRVNRDLVALNNLDTGTVWLADENLTRVENWQDVTPQSAQNEDEDDSAESTEDMAPTERSDENTPPTAVDDEFGVRPGRTTILRVLENDTDPDGDVLTASTDATPSLGPVEAVLGGGALQIAVPADATGTESFSYTANDGRPAGTASAQVTVTVRDYSLNEGPKQLRTPSVVVEQGRSVEYNVLPDWIDPDGDDLFLQSAVSTTEDEVRFTPDGRVTFQDVGISQGRKTVVITVSDGTEAVEGELTIDVRPAGQLPPITVPDHVTTTVGTPVTIAPLENDRDPNGDQLRLAKVDEHPSVTFTLDFDAGTVTASAATAGTYYLIYTVTDGPNAATGIIRMDVLDPAAADAAPVAVRDVAMLPVGGEVVIDPLANDLDPAGGVLVVQSVNVPADSGLQVALIDQHLLRITATRALDTSVSFDYTISNGIASATAQVVVLSVPRPATLLPPVAIADEANVRVGDVVDISVLANDSHPNGDALTLVHDLAGLPAAGFAFTATNRVRYQAPDEPTTVYLIYEVADSSGQKSSAQVTINVRAADPDRNSPPRPRDLQGRVIAGSEVRIEVPLAGIDPDGDSVTLTGLGSAPTKGRVTEVGRDYFIYEATAIAAGTDTFTYRVTDRLGAMATGTVRVGIAPPSGSNSKPVAAPDVVQARPGRVVAVDVLANDSDPDGDKVSIVPDSVEVISGDIKPVIEGRYIELTTPATEGPVVFYYSITDGRGGTAEASVTVEVSETSLLLPPRAVDDVVARADLAANATTARVPVLENDSDPDGSTADLTITVTDPNASVEGDEVVVRLTAQQQIVAYTVTDVDGLTGSAFIWLPAISDSAAEVRTPPFLTSTTPLEVKTGEELKVSIPSAVTVDTGRTARLTVASSATALQSDGSAVMVDESTLRFVSAQGYVGAAALTFEVTDGTGPDDPDGLKAFLTIPITVLPGDNQPPTFTGGTVSVSPGEAPLAVNLREMAQDADPGDLAKLTFELLGGAGNGIEASISDGTLNVSAGSQTPKGTTANLTLRISDGTSTPIEGQVTVNVTASTRPLATVPNVTIEKAPQGRAQNINVLDGAVSPFPGEPLHLVGSASLETGSASVSTSGNSVSITPGSDFVGTVVVRFRVGDVTNDPTREVDGRITLVVQGRPAAPGTPQVTEVRSKTVVLQWTPPANNGAEITGYTVTGGGVSRQCAATTCAIEGLTNNVEYSFTVTATNEIGTSDPSPASAAARPDAKPSPPGAPALTFGDRQLAISWAGSAGYEGSPVTAYTLEISPPPPSGVSQMTASGTSATWAGLENGVAYQVRVLGTNLAGPSDFSGYSASEIPSGLPDAPGAPTVTRLDPVGAQAQFRVTWNEPFANGAAITGYTLQVSGAESKTVPVTGASADVAVANAEGNYTFTVTATNRSGTSAASAASQKRAFGRPGSVTGLTATPGNNAITVAYANASGNGASAGEVAYQYRVNGGGPAAMPGNKVISSGVPNNGSYTIGVRAVTSLDGVTYEGDWVDSAAVAPYGPPNIPSANAVQNGRAVTVSWGPPARNGRDFTVQVRIDSPTFVDAAQSGSQNVGDGYSQIHTICVRTVDAAGQVSPELCRDARSIDPPPARAWLSQGSHRSGNSFNVDINLANFPAGNYNYLCKADGAPDGFGGVRNGNFPASGVFHSECYTDYGGGAHEWIVVDIHGWGTTETYSGHGRWQ